MKLEQYFHFSNSYHLTLAEIRIRIRIQIKSIIIIFKVKTEILNQEPLP